KAHGRKSLPCALLHYAARLNLGVRHLLGRNRRMKYLLVVILMLCPVAHAQTEPENAEDPQFQTAMGSTDTLPSQGIPAIYPGAASEEAVAATITTAPVVTPSRQREWSDIEVYLTFAILAFTLVAWGMRSEEHTSELQS